jgi:hypothetical protein
MRALQAHFRSFMALEIKRDRLLGIAPVTPSVTCLWVWVIRSPFVAIPGPAGVGQEQHPKSRVDPQHPARQRDPAIDTP